MAIMLGANKPKFQYGSSKVKKIYKGTTQVYSSGNVCNYYVNGALVHAQEYDEGQSVLSPAYTVPSVSGRVFKGWSTTNGGQPAGSLTMGDSPISLYARFNYVVTYNFNGRNYTQEYATGANVLSPSVVSPAVSGATFLGWTNSKSGTTALTSLTMGSDPITLYALFKWSDASHTFPQIYFRYGKTQASDATGNPTYHNALSGIPLNRYSRYSFYTGSAHSNNWGPSRIELYSTSSYYYTAAYGYCGFRNAAGNEYGMIEMGHFGGNYDPDNNPVGLNIANRTFSANLDVNDTANFVIKGSISGGTGFSYGIINLDGSSDSGTVRSRLTLYGKTTTI